MSAHDHLQDVLDRYSTVYDRLAAKDEWRAMDNYDVMKMNDLFGKVHQAAAAYLGTTEDDVAANIYQDPYPTVDALVADYHELKKQPQQQ